MRRGGLSALILGVWIAGLSPAVAQSEIDHAAEYAACMDLARQTPAEGYRSGLVWYDRGGGFAARHCVAIALLNLKEYDEAAARLERLAIDMGTAETALLAEVMVQAGQAWYLAGRPDKALKLQGNLIDLQPDDATLWVDRAVTLMELQKFELALVDLTEALALNGELAEARVFKAVALRELDRLDEAWRELETVLSLAPFHPDALLERGILRQYQGDFGGARADWLQVIQDDPDSERAAAARARIEEMDVVVR